MVRGLCGGARQGFLFSFSLPCTHPSSNHAPPLSPQQTREFIMTKLRAELGITDERHAELRNALLAGKDAPWFR